jgi:uncharacterized protein YjbI with pentapeptide repeats
MAAFTRLTIVALTGMSNRIFRRKSRRARSAPTAKGTTPPAAKHMPPAKAFASPPAGPAASSGAFAKPGAATPDPPIDHFRQLSPRSSAPPIASIAAKSLPIIGVLGALMTAALAFGAFTGELPYIGPIDSANPAWAGVLVTISIWAVYLLWKVPQWQAAAWARSGNSNPREIFEIENESRGTLGQILSGVAVLTGLIFAWQQLGQTSDNLRVSEEGQITDRFSRAVDQLGSDDFTVRLGGIYALERIARDSPRDYGPVMEVLTAFARQESPLPANAAATPVTAAPRVPPDVRAVFKVIGRRTPAQVEVEMEEGGCLDLTGINAVGANLFEANLQNTCWDRSDLRGAQMMESNLIDTTFTGSNLSQQASLDGASGQGAVFANANFTGSNLSRAVLNDANLQGANLTDAYLQDTKLQGASLQSANLSRAILFGTELAGANLLNANFALASLTNVDLSGAERLTAEQIASAAIVSNSTLPVGLGTPTAP